MKHDPFFARHPVFTRAELASSCEEASPCKGRTVDALLSHRAATGSLLRVKRGLYIVVPPGTDPQSAPADSYLLASRMTEDAVLAYHTALELHGVAYSSMERLTFVTEHRLRPLVFRSMEYRAVPVPPPLRREEGRDFGVAVVDRSGLDVRVTTLERSLVDVLDRPNLGGGWEEIWRSLEAAPFFDLDAVVEHALLLGNSTTIAKVGFFLEQHREALFVEEKHLKPLRHHAPARPHYLERSARISGTFLGHWNLVVPESIVHRTWEEVL
jgi:predicted transcriptional regulator of viral defense system